MLNSLYKKIIYIAIPIALENMLYSFINFIDVFMVGKIGASAISALGIANQIFFIFTCSIFGLLSGANVLSAQYFGIRDYKSLRKITILNIIIGMVLVIPFLIIGICCPKYAVSFFSNDKDVLIYTIKYFRIILLTFPLFVIGFSFTMVLRAINMPKYSLYASTASLVINAMLNLLLIPKYGVEGAAAATVIARFITVIYLYYILLKRQAQIIPTIKDFNEIEFEFVKKLLAISSLTFIHEIFWVAAYTVKVMFYGDLGTQAFSSIQIVVSINRILFTLFIGLSNATAIIIGNEIGENNLEKAYDYSKKCMKLTIYCIIFVVIAINLFAPVILKIMDVDESLYLISRNLLFVQSLVTTVEALTLIYLVGILRAGGDIMYSMVVELSLMWIIGIPLTYLSVKVFNLSVYLVYLLSFVDDAIKLIPCIKRHISKKWIRRAI